MTLLFIILTWVEIKLFGLSRDLPFVHSIFFFGLVNFNIAIFLFLFFLIFRNVVKSFAERQQHWLGSSLKSKLVLAFVSFSVIPTSLMFVVSVFYINNSFDKWFSEKMSGVLRSSLEVTNAYYSSAREKNYHFANEIVRSVQSGRASLSPESLGKLRKQFSLDAVEYYPSLLSPRVVLISEDRGLSEIPPATLEFLKKGLEEQSEASTVHQFSDGNLVRVIVPFQLEGFQGALVVSSYVPLSLISRMDDIALAYEDFRGVNPVEYPLKSIYLIILVLMTLVILLGATWFGFYLARQLSIPIEKLGEATKKVGNRDYQKVQAQSGSAEINQLIEHFNAMTDQLETSEREVRDANKSLQLTLARLDEHSRYIEVVLSSISAGVVSVDNKGFITMINPHAAQLLGVNSKEYVGKHARKIMSTDYYRLFSDLLRKMKLHKSDQIQKEVRVTTNSKSIPLQMTLNFLYDDNRKELGKVVVFDDLTPILSAQRAAAWGEVARRIAHEIKNPLTPIKLSAQRLERRFGETVDDPSFLQSVRMIVTQVDSIKALVNEFYNFARLPHSKPEIGSLYQAVHEALELFGDQHKNVQIVFKCDTPSELPKFSFDPDQIKRVITNLVDNAIEACLQEAEPIVEIEIHFDPQVKIMSLSVSDNGPGIPENVRDRVFEPYVTSKPQGTGLGLAIVKRMVEDHNGFIRALDGKDGGTQFLIEFPVMNHQSEVQVKSDQSSDTEGLS